MKALMKSTNESELKMVSPMPGGDWHLGGSYRHLLVARVHLVYQVDQV